MKKELKIGIEQCEIILREMNRLKREHPRASVYFDGEEIRITYPLPQDYNKYIKLLKNKKKGDL